MTIKVAITDDHPMVRFGLSEMLKQEQQIEIVGEFSSGNALLAGIRNLSIDVLLLDIHMPEITGIELLPILFSENPSLKIIIVTGVESAFLAKKLLVDGVKGYLLKSTGQQILIAAIKDVANGKVFVAPEIKEFLSKDRLREETKINTSIALSEREIEILKLIALEYTTPEIAKTLFLSPRTVDNYRLGLMQKLDVKNLAGLVRKAMYLGIVE